MNASPIRVPPHKVNLLEKDIEDYLYAQPSLELGPWEVAAWVGRQVHVPSGVIDLLGSLVNEDSELAGVVVVEIKNVDIDPGALTQVCRYADDIERLLAKAGVKLSVLRVIVGPSIDRVRFAEACALGVWVITFTVSLSASFGTVRWTDEYLHRRAEEDAMFLRQDPAIGRLVQLASGQTGATDEVPDLISTQADVAQAERDR